MRRLTLMLLSAVALLLLNSCGGEGGTGSDTGGSGSLALLSPNGGETWDAQSGVNPTISWTQTGAGDSVRIELYKAGSIFLTLTVGTDNDGQYSLEIPPSVATSGEYTIRIVSLLDESITDQSETSFTIVNTEVDTTPGSITVTGPNGGESWAAGESRNISWASTNAGSSVNVDLYKGGVFTLSIAESTNNDGAYLWTVPSSVTTGTDYRVKVTSSGNASVADESDANLTITGSGTGGGESIGDEESAPTASLSCSPSSASELGGEFTCTVTLSEVQEESVNVQYLYSGTATPGTDWNLPNHGFGSHIGGGTASFDATNSNTSYSWTFFGVGDSETEGDETIIVDIGNITNPSLSGSTNCCTTDVIEDGTQRQTLTLTDEVSAAPMVTMSCDQHDRVMVDGYRYSEIHCTFNLSFASTEQVDISLAYSGTATAGTDYKFYPGHEDSGPVCTSDSPCDVPAGHTSSTPNLILYDYETEWDGSQTVVIDIDSVTNAAEDGTQRAELTLNNDGRR